MYQVVLTTRPKETGFGKTGFVIRTDTVGRPHRTIVIAIEHAVRLICSMRGGVRGEDVRTVLQETWQFGCSDLAVTILEIPKKFPVENECHEEADGERIPV